MIPKEEKKVDTALTVKQFRHRSWAAMIQEQAESGLTVREWCRQNSISTKGFYYRRKQVQGEILQSAGAQFAELVLPQAGPDLPDHAGRSGSGFTPQLTISLNGASIGVNENTPGHLLREVLGVIRDA